MRVDFFSLCDFLDFLEMSGRLTVFRREKSGTFMWDEVLDMFEVHFFSPLVLLPTSRAPNFLGEKYEALEDTERTKKFGHPLDDWNLGTKVQGTLVEKGTENHKYLDFQT